ncbi:hypothetical protein MNBD_GAMMA17-2287 [hydrothermal vent metagenome]|uniref:Uncharacterized protein n=1 Tax=hydrothermal vent metagenome TaxID=652676 RepID=A0A3B0ZK27_9ZZZZ
MPKELEENLGMEFDDADEHLETMFNRLKRWEWFWLSVGVIAVGLSGYTAWDMYDSLLQRIKLENVSTTYIEIVLLLKGLVLFSVPSAVATYSFKLSKAYIHERLKRAERKHAINFGKFFMKKYGDSDLIREKVTAEDIINAFQWNISSETAFSRTGSGSFDMQSFVVADKIVDLAKNLGSTNSKDAATK